MNLQTTRQIDDLLSQVQSQINGLIQLLKYHQIESKDYNWIDTRPHNHLHMLNKLNMAIERLEGYEVNQDNFNSITSISDMDNYKIEKLTSLSCWLDNIHKGFKVDHINKNADQLLTSSCSVLIGFSTNRWIPQESKNYL